MIYKTESRLPDYVRVIFELPASLWAHKISVAGDFNDWLGQPLHQERNGAWRTAIDIPANGQYKFHYLVDGQRLLDRYADGLSQGADGEQESLLSTTIAQHRHYQEAQGSDNASTPDHHTQSRREASTK